MVDDLKATLEECAKKEPEDSFEQRARPADAYKLGNHPAFRSIVGADGEGECDEPAATEDAAAAQRKEEDVVVKVTDFLIRTLQFFFSW